jgi:hypothetical protein
MCAMDDIAALLDQFGAFIERMSAGLDELASMFQDPSSIRARVEIGLHNRQPIGTLRSSVDFGLGR